MTGTVSIGVAGALGPDLIARLAARVEAAGFHALWVNDTPDGDALAALAAAARTTTGLVLATGVIPLDRRPADEIVVAARDLPRERTVIGIGSGRTSSLRLVRDGVRTVRDGLAVPVVVGALGPRMRRLGAEEASGILLNWLTPDAAAAQRGEQREIDPGTRVALYVRTALTPDGVARRDVEAARYGASPHYAANFARLGFGPDDTVLPGDDGVSAGIARYRAAVDDVVLRVVTGSDTVDELDRFVAEAGEAAVAAGAAHDAE